MDLPRYHHTLTTEGGAAPLVCGGGDRKRWKRGDVDIRKTCEQYNSTSNSWKPLSARLRVERYGHSAWWDNTTGITYLMGGRREPTSVDIISTSGNVSTITKPFWTLRNNTK